jgi:predicted Zn-dependent protease
MRQTFLLSLCLSSMIVTGCSTLKPAGESTDPAPEKEAQNQAAEDGKVQRSQKPPAAIAREVERSFEPNILYGLLAAEMAAERGRFDITLVNYVEAAKRTRDVGVIRRALRFAQGLGADNAQYQVAKVWLETEPDNVEALRIAAVQAIKHDDFESALGYMDRIYSQGERAEFDNLGTYAASVPPEEQETLITTFRRLQDAFPERSEIGFNLAILQYTAGRADEAVATLKPILDREPEYQPAIALYSTLLFESGERDEAVRYLRSQTRRYPGSRKLGTLYARMLVDAGQLQPAQDEFQRLLKQSPDNDALRLSHALVALENKQTNVAREQLQRLVENGEHSSEAHFYLGRLAESEGNRKQALRHYMQVERGSQFFAALTRSGELLAEQGELDAALQRLERLRQRLPNQADRLWLVEINLLSGIDQPTRAIAAADEAVAAFPDNVSIRYARAMINDQQDNLEAAERDLRWIIEREPDNAVALNALGYTLTLKTERYDEALELIQKAHELVPDNAAIIDSLGWVHFKRGDREKALEYLTEAYEAFPDSEVAAHLGEVLWSLGREDDARRVLEYAVEEDPKDKTLIETLERLGVGQESQ